MKLGDHMEREGSRQPAQIWGDEVKRLGAVLKARFPHLNKQTVVLLATPVSRPRNIIDAKPLAGCVLCGSKMWVSPNSFPHLNNGAVPVCLSCAELAIYGRTLE